MANQTNQEAATPVEPTFHITSPHETTHLANDLARFIRENKLFHNIQGKEYVNVEGWQYAGCRLGILPVVEALNQIQTADEAEIKYQAKVKLVDLRTNAIVGTGFAMCSNKESGKKYYQEFAIASMSQTRAIGKAYRNILAWIIRAAGYEPTPAEEMDYKNQQPTITESRPDVQAFEAEKKQPLFDDKGNPVESYSSEQFKLLSKLVSSSVFTPEEQMDYQKRIRTMSKDNAAGLINSVQGLLEARKAQLKSKEPAVDPNAPKPLTINQKTQILLLLNNSVITKEEKERMVAKVNTFDTERATQAIEKLKKVIKDRSSGRAGLIPSFTHFISLSKNET
jgi:hypothetical protein